MESAVENCSGFMWWKARYRKSSIQGVVLVLAVVIGILVMLVSVELDDYGKEDIIFVILVLALFSLIAIHLIRSYILSFRMHIDNYWIGTVTSMRREVKPNRKAKRYFVCAVSNGKEIEGRCFVETYRRANIGDKVLLFTVGGNTVYCVHQHMN